MRPLWTWTGKFFLNKTQKYKYKEKLWQFNYIVKIQDFCQRSSPQMKLTEKFLVQLPHLKPIWQWAYYLEY